MCLAAIAIEQHPRFALVIAANRDEYFERPSLPMAWWRATPQGLDLLAGRDLSAGGTWMGLNQRGRLGLLTNVRNPAEVRLDAPSRGSLVPRWLDTPDGIDRFSAQAFATGHNGFNLVAADLAQGAQAGWHWLHSASPQPQAMAAGLYGLSNGLLDEPWPKVERLRRDLALALDRHENAQADRDKVVDDLLLALRRDDLADDALLPRTGVPLDVERWLSAAFIRSPDGRYGTRCSTVLVTERTPEGCNTLVVERTYAPDARQHQTRRVVLDGWPAR